MFKSLAIFSLFAAVSTMNAQSIDPQVPEAAAPAQPAPIVRSYHSALRQLRNRIVESQPIAGVWLRSEAQNDNRAAVETLSATSQRAEFRLQRGRLNVTVHHPADHAEILVDLPGGQVSLLKDGLYTFNADTGTIRVLHGEAAAYLGATTALGTSNNAAPNTKPVKIKEDHQLSLVASTSPKPGQLKSIEAYPYELAADLLPSGNADRTYGDRAYADYGDGYPPRYYAGVWGYPAYYPGFYGFPFSYGIGFGYYGGFGGGYGYRGGYRR